MVRRLFLVVLALALMVQAGSGQIVQAPGTDYLVFEAEDFSIDDLNNEDTGWIIIDPTSPTEVELRNSNPGTINVPPPNANMSNGLAIFDLVGGGFFRDQVGWELSFATPGEYFLYARYSFYDLENIIDNNYGNEDSVYIPAFELSDDPAEQSEEVRTDGAGEASLQRTPNKDFDATADFQPTPADSCRIDEEPWVIDEAECAADGLRADLSFDGQYHWQKVRYNKRGGIHSSYLIEDTDTFLDFSIATRERGSSLDVLVLSQDSELTLAELDRLISSDPYAQLDDGSLTDLEDRRTYVHDTLGTWIGDSNKDGEFNSGDLVAVLAAGEYEDAIPMNSTWEEGDWNGDMEFSSADLVYSLGDGGYEAGARAAKAAVPEPNTLILLLMGMAAIAQSPRLTSNADNSASVSGKALAAGVFDVTLDELTIKRTGGYTG